MTRTLRQKALNQLQAERNSGADEIRIIVRGKGRVGTGQRISPLAVGRTLFAEREERNTPQTRRYPGGRNKTFITPFVAARWNARGA
jgi:hypothetical protein